MRRSLPRLAALCSVAAAAALAAAPASAHPDPAGEFLTTQQLFVSYDAHLPTRSVNLLRSAVASAVRQGFDIRVALIWRRDDLGKVPQYWRRPNAYAAFMYGENWYFFKGARLLVVMPNGFGFAWKGHPLAEAYRTLAPVRLGTTAPQLAAATVEGVERLAAAGGVHITATAGSNEDNSDRVKILVGVAILLLAWAVLRRFRPRRLTVQ